MRDGMGLEARLVPVVALWLVLTAPGSPAQAQAFQVGHRQVTFQDPARGNRSVQTEIYYPALTGGDEVPVAPGTFPVLTFGHGFLIVWSAYQYLWAALAPEGYILAFPRTEAGLFPDHLEFGRDLEFLVARLQEAGGDPSSPFYERVGAASAVMGHSMGGGASFLAVPENPAITAVANLAAAETNPSAIQAAARITIPALLFSGSLDCVTPPAQHQIPMYQALASQCKTLVSVSGGSHCQFADYNFTCSFGEGGCPTPTVSREVQHAITLSYLTPWLAFQLKGQGEAWNEFQARLQDDPGITYLQNCATTGTGIRPEQSAAGIAVTFGPNPFRTETRIRLDLVAPASAIVRIFDPRGRSVFTLHQGPVPVGRTEFHWDGRDLEGRPVASGVYRCRLSLDGRSLDRSIVLLR